MIPYKGYIEVNLSIQGLTQYNEDVLFLAILDHKYWKKVPVLIGTYVIDHLVMNMTKEELQQTRDTWNQVHLSLNVLQYSLKGVMGNLYTLREVVISQFMTIVVKGIPNLMVHSKCMNVGVEPVTKYLEYIAIA